MVDTVERRSKLVTLVYQVLGTFDLPPVEASEGEVLAALANAFHRKALVAAGGGTRHAATQTRVASVRQHVLVEPPVEFPDTPLAPHWRP